MLTSRRTLLTVVWSACLLLLCIWPALYNGQPLFFADTSGYIRGADAGVSKLTHHPSVWSSENPQAPQTSPTAEQSQPRKSFSSIANKTVLAGRSIYYGAFLYFGHLTGQLWPAVLAQAGAAILAIALTLQSFQVFTWKSLSLIVILLAVLTPMSFFASYLMPDIFTAIAILAIAILLATGNHMTVALMTCWLLLLVVSLLFHTSHVLIAAAMLFIGVCAALLTRFKLNGKALAGIVAALLIAAGGETLFNLVTTKLVGAPPIRPPFLMARLIADGPGLRYLSAHCPDSGLTICQFAPRLPKLLAIRTNRPPSDEILWNTDPSLGVFGAADPATQRKLANEQFQFAKATLLFDPVGVFKAWTADVLRQIGLFNLDEFLFDDGERAYFTGHIPEPYLHKLQGTRIWNDIMPIHLFSILSAIAAFLAIAGLVILAVARRRVIAPRTPLFAFLFMIVSGILLNAAICGMLSTPHHRYQARVVWLLPLTTLVIGQVLIQQSWNRRDALESAGVRAGSMYGQESGSLAG